VPRRTLIAGCGYLGLALAQALRARGDEVTGWVRSESSAAEVKAHGIDEVLVGSVADEACWQSLAAFDAVVHCAASGGGGAPAYREVYLEGMRQMNRHQPRARRVFVSSTSVYGQTDGAWVQEISEAEPKAETSRVLVETEREAIAGGANVIRAAGIYGPGRAALFEKLRRGEAVMEGDGARWVNQVQRDDLAGAVLAVLDGNRQGEIYNAADDEPVMLRDFYAWCSRALDLPMPPAGSVDPNRKRGLTNKRVSNRKLRGLGWAPLFPTFREGLADRIADGHSPR
jgi:nucleoside-diphosphate-sugar epimerase